MGNWTPMLKGLLDLFLQSSCPLCQRPTAKEFCHDCQRQLQRCQMTNPEQFWRGELPVFAWGVYGGAVKRAMRALKYDKQTQVAQPLGYWLAEAWLNSSPAAGRKLTVVPIPLHGKKLRDRGFNQAQLLAESFCQVTGLPLQRHGLERVRETEAQYTQSATERQQNLAGAFQLGKGFCQWRPDSPILLLDDIYTTGATARSAAGILRQKGIQVCGIVAIATSKQTTSLRPIKPVN